MKFTFEDDEDQVKIIHSGASAFELHKLGIPVMGKRASMEECENADVVVCSPRRWGSEFKDNLYGHCSKCGEPIHFRPHVPKKPPKVCFPCAYFLMMKAPKV